MVLRKTGDGYFVAPHYQTAFALPQKTPQKTPQKILAVIRANPLVGTQEIADLIGLDRSAVARAIAKLKKSGLLDRIGPDKGGHWEVMDQ